MIVEILLTLAGILIVIYPQLFIIIGSFLFVFVELSIILIKYRFKEVIPDWQNPFMVF